LTVKFTLIPDQGNSELTKLLVWTTTPWTLPSNLALCVRADFDYAVMHHDGERWVLAESAIERYVPELRGFKQIETIKGSELIGRHYLPLFPYFNNAANNASPPLAAFTAAPPARSPVRPVCTRAHPAPPALKTTRVR
jgi:isoleucyl-tRNA synthetase